LPIAGNVARLRVAFEHARGAPEGVAGKLVQQDQQSEGAVSVINPAAQFAAASRFMGAHEARAELAVKSFVLAKPPLGTGRAPEVQHVPRLDRRQGLAHADG
jgi:hypothetical protein